MSFKNSSGTIGNRTRDLSACSAVPQPTSPRSVCKVAIIPATNFNFTNRFKKKTLNVKLHENPSSGSHVVPCGKIYMTKLIVGFRNFASAPEKERVYLVVKVKFQ